MKRNKIFIACDTTKIDKVKKIINFSKSSSIKIGYKFGLEFVNSKNGRKFISELKNKTIFLDLKLNDIITVKVKSTSSKGIVVVPEGSEIEVLIKKNQIAINAEDARSNRFIQGDRIDAAIAEIDLEKRKLVLSIKLLEEMQNKEAVSKFSSPLSGKNLPFSSLSEKLDKKKEDK